LARFQGNDASLALLSLNLGNKAFTAPQETISMVWVLRYRFDTPIPSCKQARQVPSYEQNIGGGADGSEWAAEVEVVGHYGGVIDLFKEVIVIKAVKVARHHSIAKMLRPIERTDFCGHLLPP